MPRVPNETDPFEHFATKLTNVRLSWSGKALEGSVVAPVLWQDLV